MRFVRKTQIVAITVGLGAFSAGAVICGTSPREAIAQTQGAPTPAPDTPMLKVYSRETIVDITVVDAKGNPVHGLKQEQFTVKEDNKPQTIRSFEEFRSQPTLPLPKLPPNVYTNLQPVGASGAVDILLLDGLNTAPPDASNPDQIRYSIPIQTRVKQEAAKYLKTMPAGTRVAVLGLSRSLRILQGFSSDPNLLAAAVGTMEMNMDGRASTPAQWCAQQDMHNRMTLEALNQIAASVSPIKGKKNLIWFTAGFPTITDPSVASQAVCDSSAIAAAIAAAPRGPIGVTQQLAIPPGHGLPDYLAELRKSYGLLAAAQVAVFPIGAAGLGKLPSPTASGFVGPGTNEMAEINLSFESMAEATGGTAFYNTNDLAGAVAKAAEKGASYYTLSYVPPGKKYDNAHHTIKIAVNQPGLTLVYRTTYDAVDPATIRPAPGLTLATTRSDAAQTGQHTSPETEMRFAMGRSMPTSQQILFDVRVEPSTEPSKPTDPPIFGALDSKFTNKPLTPYAFSYAIPARQIAFTDAPDGARNGDMEFDIVAYDERGNLVNSIRQSIKLALTAEQVAQLAHSPFRFLQRLDLPSGQFFLRIGILDRTSSKIGSLEIPLLVGKDSAESKTNREMPEVKKDH